ncbi:WD40 repeat domain-containing protein [Flindersiella endophytica]
MVKLVRRGALVAISIIATLLSSAIPAAAAAPDLAWTGGGTIGIQQAVVSPDGQVLATASQDNMVKLWRTSDGSLIRTLASHDGSVYSVAFSPDGRFLASAGEFVFGDPSGNVKLWRVSDGAFLGDFASPTPNLVFSIAVSPDGTLLAAGYQNGADGGVINLFRMSDRSFVASLVGHTDSVFSVAFSPDGQRLASGSADQTVKVWNVPRRLLERTLTGHTFFVGSVDFSPDGTLLASGSWDQSVRIWRTSDFRLVRTIPKASEDLISSIDFSGDSQTLAVGGFDNAIRLFQVSTGRLLITLDDKTQAGVSSVAFVSNPAGTAPGALVSGSFDSHARIWDVATGAVKLTFGKHTGSVRYVEFSPDGSLLASASDDTTARLWRAGDGKEVATLAEHPYGLSQVAFSPDGGLLATVDGNPTPGASLIKIWRTGSTASSLTLPGHNLGTTGVGFGPGGRTLITTGNDRVLRVWRVSDGTLLATNSTGRPQGLVEMSPDNTVAAVPGQGGVQLYDALTGARLRILGGAATSESPLSFSPNGKFLAIGVQQFGANIQVVNVSDGTIQTLKGDSEGFMQGVAFTADSAKVIAGSGFSRRIQIWDVASGDPLVTYDQETGWGPFVRLPINTSAVGSLYAYGRGDGPVSVAKNPF